MIILLVTALLFLGFIFINRFDFLIYTHAASIPFFIVIPGVSGYFVTPLFVLTGLILITHLLRIPGTEDKSILDRKFQWSIRIYLFGVLVTFIGNPSTYALISAAPRLMIVVSGIIVGSYIARTNKVEKYLELFTLSTFILSLLSLTRTTAYFDMNKNHLGLIFAMAAIVSILNLDHKIKNRIFVPFFVVALISTGSRSSILGLALCITLLLFFKSKTSILKRMILFLLLPTTVSIIFINVNFPFKERLLDFTPNMNTSGGYSIFVRIELYKQAWDQFNEHRVLGNGLGGVTLDTFYRTPDAHNFLLQALGEGGLVLGLATLVLLLNPIRYFASLREPMAKYQSVTFYLWVIVFTHGLLDVFWVMGRTNLFWVALGVLVSQRSTPEIRRISSS